MVAKEGCPDQKSISRWLIVEYLAMCKENLFVDSTHKIGSAFHLAKSINKIKKWFVDKTGCGTRQ